MGREAVEKVLKRLRNSYERSHGHRPDAKTERQLRQYVEWIGEVADKRNRMKDAGPIRVRRGE